MLDAAKEDIKNRMIGRQNLERRKREEKDTNVKILKLIK